jgi:hypothetical protein
MCFFLGIREGFWDSHIENHRLSRLTVNASPLITRDGQTAFAARSSLI